MDGYFAATSFELEAERRREVLEATMRNGRHRAPATDSVEPVNARPMAPSKARWDSLLTRVSLKA